MMSFLNSLEEQIMSIYLLIWVQGYISLQELIRIKLLTLILNLTKQIKEQLQELNSQYRLTIGHNK